MIQFRPTGTFWVAVFLVFTFCLGGMMAHGVAATPDEEAQSLIDSYVTEVRPLEITTGRAWWEANTTGSDAAFAAKEAAQNKLDAALSNRERFAQLKQLKDASIQDRIVKRQIQLLYLYHLEKQVSREILEQMVAKANAIEKGFNVFRAIVDSESMTDSQVRKVLSESKNSEERRKVWLASKGVGGSVEASLKELVKLRNQAATSVGFRNYQDMALQLNEQKPEQILALFDELDQLTREPFAKVKAEIDAILAKQYGIAVADLRPWHYHDPFFQEPPAVFETDFDAVFKPVDIQAICREFYAGIGLPIDDVLARSDLFEKPGKSPHAFCTDIDREGDVRVLGNIVPNEYWMTTMLHELGHSVYSSKFIPRSLPYLVRSESHILTTEGIAMMFERLASSSQWLAAMHVKVANPSAYDAAAKKMRQNKLLIFSRWCQVMFRFEKGMYEQPDQDLNKLWWDLVEKYQLLKRPEGRSAPDYGSKIHIVSAPVYYHNYLMGELFACQLHACIARDVLKNSDPTTAVYSDNPAVGAYLRERVFDLGRTLPWNEMVEKSTGQPLSPAAFAREFSGN